MSQELLYCPGCRNGCPLSSPTCGIGEKFAAQQKKAKEKQQAEPRGGENAGADAEK